MHAVGGLARPDLPCHRAGLILIAILHLSTHSSLRKYCGTLFLGWQLGPDAPSAPRRPSRWGRGAVHPRSHLTITTRGTIRALLLLHNDPLRLSSCRSACGP